MFKKHESARNEKEGAEIIQSYQRAYEQGVGVKLHAASVVRRGNSVYVLAASENFFEPPAGGKILHQYVSYKGSPRGDIAAHLEDFKDLLPSVRMEIALQLYKALAHTSDSNFTNILAKTIELPPGSPRPFNAIPIGANRYLQIAAIDLSHSKSAYLEVDLLKQPIPGKTLKEILLSHGEEAGLIYLIHPHLSKISKDLRIDHNEFLQKANELKLKLLAHDTHQKVGNAIHQLVGRCLKPPR